MKKHLAILALLVLLFIAGTAVVSAAGNDKVQTADKQVYCNQEGNSGKWKAQIANGQPNEHEQKLDGVFVHDQGDVTAAMDKACNDKYGTPPVEETCPAPKFVYNEHCYTKVDCPTGTTLIDYKDPNTKQDPICKGNPTGCPYGDSIPVDSPKCVAPDDVENTTDEYVPTPDGGMKNTTTGEVFYGK